jgi:hypothetical protein
VEEVLNFSLKFFSSQTRRQGKNNKNFSRYKNYSACFVQGVLTFGKIGGWVLVTLSLLNGHVAQNVSLLFRDQRGLKIID